MELSSVLPSRLQRTACDRCRRQKLRCSRDSGNEQCLRCLRVGESCTTAAARKPGRPVTRQDATQPIRMPSEPSTALRTPPDTSSSTPNSNSVSSLSSGLPAGGGGGGGPYVETLHTHTGHDRVAQMERRSNCMRQLGELHVNLHVDVDLMRCAQPADHCTHSDLDVDELTPSFFISRLFNHGNALLDISNHFDLREKATASGMIGDRLSCDVPTMTSMISCYIMITRVSRIILSMVLASIPVLLDPQRDVKVRDIFQGLKIGDYSLEGRTDLQMLFVAQTAEDIVSKLETRFGVAGFVAADRDGGLLPGSDARATTNNATNTTTQATEILTLLLKSEAAEQPPMDEPKGHCGTLHEIVRDIKRQLQDATRRDT